MSIKARVLCSCCSVCIGLPPLFLPKLTVAYPSGLVVYCCTWEACSSDTEGVTLVLMNFRCIPYILLSQYSWCIIFYSICHTVVCLPGFSIRIWALFAHCMILNSLTEVVCLTSGPCSIPQNIHWAPSMKGTILGSLPWKIQSTC